MFVPNSIKLNNGMNFKIKTFHNSLLKLYEVRMNQLNKDTTISYMCR